MQLTELFSQFDELHKKYGSPDLTSIYGAGKIEHPKILLLFMNPTARNIASNPSWKGLKAPWIGTKNVWKLLSRLGLFNNAKLLNEIALLRPEEWTYQFATDVYSELVKESIYLTNIAKCTQDDAKHLPDSVYKVYLPLMIKELELIQPQKVISFGNQVSSILLQRPISVSKYSSNEFETLKTDRGFSFTDYPTYYPVGQGMRNIAKAINRIQSI